MDVDYLLHNHSGQLNESWIDEDVEDVYLNQGFLYSLGVVNMLICFIGLAGNGLVFYVVCRFSVMHTVTNVFILALALADIAFLVNIPLLVATSIFGDWRFGNVYCKIYYSISTINQFASSFFLVIMSADRYFAICLPIWSRRVRTTGTAILICTFVWTLAIGFMYPVFLYSGAETAPNDTRTHCSIDWSDSIANNTAEAAVEGHRDFALYCFVLGYALPVVMMITFYGLVLRKLRSRHEKVTASTSLQTASNNSCKRASRLRKVTMMIFVVIIVYLMCWTPYWVLQLFLVLATVEPSSFIIFACLTLQCLCFANSAINPILYAVLSENFKQSYAKAFKRRNGCRISQAVPSFHAYAPTPSTIREMTATPSVAPQPTYEINMWLKGDAQFQVRSNLLVLL